MACLAPGGGRVACIALASLLAAGCKDKRPEPETESPASPGDAAAAAPDPPPAPIDLTVLDQGAEPRRTLRYRLEPGSTEVIELTLRYRANNRIQASPARELTFPVMRLSFSIGLEEAPASDRVRYQFELASTGLGDTASADQALVAMAGAALKKAEGLRGSAVVNPRGVIREGELDIPPGLDPGMRMMMESMRSSMEQLSSPLPAEPVGQGARWELRQVLVQGGVTLEQITVYELVEVTEPEGEGAPRVVLRGELRQNANRQEVSLSGVDRAELIGLEAAGTSEIELDLGRLSPRKGAMSLESESRFEISAGGKTKALVSRGNLELSIAGK